MSLFILPPPYWIINELKYLIPYFILSIYFKKYDWQKCPLWLFVISLTLFVLLLNIFTFDYSLYRMTDEMLTIKYTYMSIIRFLSGISGIICSLYICKWINKIPYISNYYVYIGTLTLPIYVLHQKFLMIERIVHYKTENILMIIASSLIIIELSIITYRLLKKNKYIQLFLFGEKI